MAPLLPPRIRCLAVGLLLLCLAVVTAQSVVETGVDGDGTSDLRRLGQATAAAASSSSSKRSGVEIKHKPLLPLGTGDYVSFVLAALGLIVAAAGGIGGGGVLMPLYILVSGFDLKSAVALSNITMFGGAISNVALAARRRHPHKDKPLIDWSLIMIMEPPVIAGAVVGSIVNRLLPTLVIMICMVLTLSYLAKRTMTKGLKLWKQEGGWQGVFGGAVGHTLGGGSGGGGDLPTTHQGQAGESRGLLSGGQQRQPGRGSKYGAGGGGPTIADLDEDAVQRIQEKERRVACWQPTLLALCFFGMSMLQVLKSLFDCGSAVYWVLTAAVLLWIAPFFLIGRQHVLRDYRKKVLFAYPFHKGDVKWDDSNSVRYPLLCSLAGLASGLMGIGGGMVKAPLLLEMGVLPAVQAATVATMILFTTGASTISLTLLGLMPLDYAVAFFFFGMVWTGVGAAAVRQALMRHKKQSIIVLSVGLVISTAVVTMGIRSFLQLAEDPESILDVGTLCGAGAGE